MAAVVLIHKRLEVLEHNFNSFSDFAVNKISEIEAISDFCKIAIRYHDDAIMKYEQLYDAYDFQLKCLQYDYYSHMHNMTHLDENLKIFKPPSVVEDEIKLINLEQSIRKKASKYGLPTSLKPRPGDK